MESQSYKIEITDEDGLQYYDQNAEVFKHNEIVDSEASIYRLSNSSGYSTGYLLSNSSDSSNYRFSNSSDSTSYRFSHSSDGTSYGVSRSSDGSSVGSSSSIGIGMDTADYDSEEDLLDAEVSRYVYGK